MRIRYKKWARPELEACSFYIDNPEENKGKWHSIFRNKGLLYIELGCGKGAFISKLAVSNPEINFIGVDLVDAILWLSKRNIEKVYK